ncbi:MAG: pyrimidine dimer DNA glycosylase/endonuclease V [Patescibacteria group bacterium]|nr:pyrimidine dimer DNA glycosylase/endonuclease V [Patescibacteria group bacterium]MDD4304152.1 pyrimidine dimer DNA glycosylase/endonuclease V [Patescibacteria group bacterium]MDD4695183.1 pyrimidine dimer DNA glycosylase/endonuclease V [Patescibacteria group bacterium]
MRLWSIHPKYLDKIGLVALWRESLLAKKVLEGKTKGYKNHPQLERFKKSKNSISSINQYLLYIIEEAKRRNYNFDVKKIQIPKKFETIKVNSKQLEYEFNHLIKKLEKRSPDEIKKLKAIKKIEANSIFETIQGKIENWEKLK